MSRGRGGRGRGGSNKSFSKEQLSSLGVSGSEVVPGPVTQPPPLFPLLDHKPISLNITNDMKYQLMLKQDYIDNLRDSPSYIRLPVAKSSTSGDYEIDQFVAQIPNIKNTFNWTMFPAELRPKLLAKRLKKEKSLIKQKIKTETDIVEHLNKLEKMESSAPVVAAVKEEVVEDNDEDLALDEDEEDEEMDDGTDYANNYFDNGEAYEDEDDNLEDGPIY